jgi:hypothetical protein
VARRIEWKAFAREEVVEVPLAEEMDDETFIKHVEHRHANDVKMEGGTMSRHAMQAWLPSYRAFHERLHDIARPGQYNHEHAEDEE